MTTTTNWTEVWESIKAHPCGGELVNIGNWSGRKTPEEIIRFLQGETLGNLSVESSIILKYIVEFNTTKTNGAEFIRTVCFEVTEGRKLLVVRFYLYEIPWKRVMDTVAEVQAQLSLLDLYLGLDNLTLQSNSHGAHWRVAFDLGESNLDLALIRISGLTSWKQSK